MTSSEDSLQLEEAEQLKWTQTPDAVAAVNSDSDADTIKGLSPCIHEDTGEFYDALSTTSSLNNSPRGVPQCELLEQEKLYQGNQDIMHVMNKLVNHPSENDATESPVVVGNDIETPIVALEEPLTYANESSEASVIASQGIFYSEGGSPTNNTDRPTQSQANIESSSTEKTISGIYYESKAMTLFSKSGLNPLVEIPNNKMPCNESKESVTFISWQRPGNEMNVESKFNLSLSEFETRSTEPEGNIKKNSTAAVDNLEERQSDLVEYISSMNFNTGSFDNTDSGCFDNLPGKHSSSYVEVQQKIGGSEPIFVAKTDSSTLKCDTEADINYACKIDSGFVEATQILSKEVEAPRMEEIRLVSSKKQMDLLEEINICDEDNNVKEKASGRFKISSPKLFTSDACHRQKIVSLPQPDSNSRTNSLQKQVAAARSAWNADPKFMETSRALAFQVEADEMERLENKRFSWKNLFPCGRSKSKDRSRSRSSNIEKKLDLSTTSSTRGFSLPRMKKKPSTNEF